MILGIKKLSDPIEQRLHQMLTLHAQSDIQQLAGRKI